MTVNERPSFDDAVAIALDAIRVAKADGAEDKLILAILRSKMYDDKLLDKKSRQEFLREINNELKTSYPMNQVRKADPSLLHVATGATGHKEPTLVEVEGELNGSVDVHLPPKQEELDDIDVVLQEETLKTAILNPTIKATEHEANADLSAFVHDLFEAGFGLNPPDIRIALYDKWTAKQPAELVEELETVRKQLRSSTPDDQFFTFLRGLDKALWEDFKTLVLTKDEEPQPEPAPSTDANESVTEPALEQPTMTTNARSALERIHAVAEQPVTSLPVHSAILDAAKGETLTLNTETSTSDEKATNMKNDTVTSFIAGLVAFGYTTEEARAKLFEEFLSIHPQFRMAINAQPKDIGVSEAFFAAATLNGQLEETFTLWVLARHPEIVAKMASEMPGAATAEEKSRFSIMGSRDEGVRSSWVAAVSALIGGGLEMSTAGNMSVGSGVGTVLGAVGSFFLAEQTDKMIDGQFGRYVAAGTMGLALGAIGSKAGRATESAIFGSGQGMEAPTAIEIPKLGNLLPASAESFGIASLGGL